MEHGTGFFKLIVIAPILIGAAWFGGLGTAAGAESADQAEVSKIRTKLSSMNMWQACSELGRVLRTAEKQRRQPYAGEVIQSVSQAYRVGGDEWQAISSRKVQIGMSECGLIASRGKPSALNTTTSARGTSRQWVYSGAFVYTENGLITAMQH